MCAHDGQPAGTTPRNSSLRDLFLFYFSSLCPSLVKRRNRRSRLRVSKGFSVGDINDIIFTKKKISSVKLKTVVPGRYRVVVKFVPNRVRGKHGAYPSWGFFPIFLDTKINDRSTSSQDVMMYRLSIYSNGRWENGFAVDPRPLYGDVYCRDPLQIVHGTRKIIYTRSREKLEEKKNHFKTSSFPYVRIPVVGGVCSRVCSTRNAMKIINIKYKTSLKSTCIYKRAFVKYCCARTISAFKHVSGL